VAELKPGDAVEAEEVSPAVHGPLSIKAKPAWGWCAGVRHPPKASYPADFFTPQQVYQLRRDPTLAIEGLPPDPDADDDAADDKPRGRKKA
jgi:hypothetical protein